MNKRYFLLMIILIFSIYTFSDSVSFDSLVQQYDLKKDSTFNSKDDRNLNTDDRPQNDKVIRFEFGNKGKEQDNKKTQGIELLFDILSSAHGNNNNNDIGKNKGKDYSNLFSYRSGNLEISRRLGRIKDVKQKRDKLLFIMSSGYLVLFSWSDYNTEFIYYSDDLMFNEKIIDFEMLGSRLMYLVFSRWSRIRVMIFDTFYGETILNRVY